MVNSALVLLLGIILCGCASTTIYESGVPVLKMQADATNVTFLTAKGTYFHADTISHSVPTIAGGKAATRIISGVSGVIGATGAAVTGVKLL